MTAVADAVNDIIAPRVRAARVNAGMTQQQVADAMKALGFAWPQQTVMKIEGGTRRLTFADAIALSRVLKVSLAELADVGVPESKPEVYEHFVVGEMQLHGDNKWLRTACHKNWNPHVRGEVTVVGRCPECDAHVREGWIA